MGYRVLAETVMVVHFAFVAFVLIGGLLARWQPWLLWAHLPALGWSVAIITVGFDCPLTPLEQNLRARAGVEAYDGGFIDHYLEDVVYPERHTNTVRALAAVAIVAGYTGAINGRRPRRIRSATDQ